MDKIVISASAKVNPFFDIIGRLPNGYHTVDSVMLSVSLCDIVSVSLRESGITVSTDTAALSCDRRNIAWRAAEKYFETAGISGGAEIHIRKKIPFEAGMGGGSADGAAVIAALDRLYQTNLGREMLRRIAASVGADVPFCLLGGCLRVAGLGDEYAETLPVPEGWLCVVKPDLGVSTPAAYGELDRMFGAFDARRSRSPDRLIRLLGQGLCAVGRSGALYNIFEEVMPRLAPAIPEITDYLTEHSYGALLSGSGTAVFAVCDSESAAEQLARRTAERFDLPFSAVCRPTSHSLQFYE